MSRFPSTAFRLDYELFADQIIHYVSKTFHSTENTNLLCFWKTKFKVATAVINLCNLDINEISVQCFLFFLQLML